VCLNFQLCGVCFLELVLVKIQAHLTKITALELELVSIQKLVQVLVLHVVKIQARLTTITA
jgi:hypothetical protein